MGLHTSLLKVKAGNRVDLLMVLENISDFDCDFNGENGLEYLWGEVWESNGFKDLEDYEKSVNQDLKYESNLEWLLDKVRHIETDTKCIDEFIKTWMDNDNYYIEHEVNYNLNTKGKVTSISFSAVTE